MRAIDYFDKGAEEFPDRIAIVDRTTDYSYREAQEASRGIAKAMWAAGLRGEERVAIFSPNDARILLCMLGLMRVSCGVPSCAMASQRLALEADRALRCCWRMRINYSNEHRVKLSRSARTSSPCNSRNA